MPNEIVSDAVVKSHIVSEYGEALASVAERFLRYPDRMQGARSEDERKWIDRHYAGILRRLIASYPIALAALEEDEPTKGKKRMKTFAITMAIGVFLIMCALYVLGIYTNE